MAEFINSKEKATKIKLNGATDHDQMNIIIKVLGNPDTNDLSFMSEEKMQAFLKTYESFSGKNFASIFPSEDDECLSLIKNMLEFNPYTRFNIDECLAHSYFNEVRNYIKELEYDSGPIIDSTLTLSSSILSKF